MDLYKLSLAFKESSTFLQKLVNAKIYHLPHVSISEDQEVNFYWFGGNFTMDLGLYGDGTYSYFLQSNPDNYNKLENDVPYTRILPDEVMKYLFREKENKNNG